MTASRQKNTESAEAAAAADPAPSSASSAKAEIVRDLRAQLAALTGGMAPDDYLSAWWDWYLNLATHPPRQAQLAHSAYEKLLDSWQFFTRAA
ncbi:MAG TPA: poly-beta-hydroxybutyrate polymerase N-terminal domain-containing protein, partial [Steroidobacteraceae bacterium]|nr:poly-beta-hydroxybutyrate polymerase N-terminal domain-containing protein [Steroidobacteraceae bacterium]